MKTCKSTFSGRKFCLKSRQILGTAFYQLTTEPFGNWLWTTCSQMAHAEIFKMDRNSLWTSCMRSSGSPTIRSGPVDLSLCTILSWGFYRQVVLMERNFQWDETGCVLLSFTPALTFFFLTHTLAPCCISDWARCRAGRQREKASPKKLMSRCYCHKIGMSLKNKEPSIYLVLKKMVLRWIILKPE